MNQRFTTFLAVAEAGSLSGAAQQLFVSYQCVSAHVRSLEEEAVGAVVEHHHEPLGRRAAWKRNTA